MKHPQLFGFLLLMAFDTLVQISFKLAGNHALPVEFGAPWLLRLVSSPWLYLGFAATAGAFVTWMSLLKQVAIGPAFAASHLEVVSVMLLSLWIFNDPFTWQHGLGAVLILSGIFMLGIAETREDAADA